MNSKAIISVSSKQSGEQEDTIEVVTPGEFYKVDDSYYAVYDETKISGMEGTRTTLKVGKDSFNLIREGTTNTEMFFKKGEEDTVLYNTPYGVLEIKTKTKELKVDLNDKGGEILLDYSLNISGQSTQTTIMKINIKASERK